MTETRREFLKAASCIPIALAARDMAGVREAASAEPPRFFDSLAAAFDGPFAQSFGITAEGNPQDPQTHYSSNSLHAEDLTFDVSNNSILCSINRHGLLWKACIEVGLIPTALTPSPRGQYVSKLLGRGGPWPFQLRREGASPVNLDAIPGAEAGLLRNVFPVFTWHCQELRLRTLAFAPIGGQAFSAAPRAIVVAIQIQNQGQEPIAGALLAPARLENIETLELGRPTEVREAVAVLGEQAWNPQFPEVAFKLRPGEQSVFTFALLLGVDAEELRATRQVLRQRSPLDWLNQTWEFHATRFGELAIPEDPYFAELFVRMGELCRQSLMRLSDGKFGAGFWGSYAATPTFIWNKDNFHATLPLSFLEPRLCADAILYFLEWGVPPRAMGRGLERFPNAGRVTHSLGNALSGLVIAGAYYQMTGDREFFRAHPEIMSKARELLEEVLESRRDEPLLFPSMYVSDGDSRGDYHTGSNLVAWYAFRSMARIAREAYQETEPAREWSRLAEIIKEDIWKRCTGMASLGKQFVEGAMADWTWIVARDGEESDTNLMPFYGFCESDEAAYLNHARAGLTPQNPYYAAPFNGIWWFGQNLRWVSTTFPGWMTGLAGCSNEHELHEHLERIRTLVDADGSIWWWPYAYGTTDPTRPDRLPVGGKCGWAAGVYLCLFVHNILGLSLDLPSRRISLRPFCPWEQFRWSNCRLGHGVFDIHYQKEQARIVGEIWNRNPMDFDGMIELMLPEGAALTACKLNGHPTSDYQSGKRYGRLTAGISSKIARGGTMQLEVSYRMD
jgi:hypothetical protein